MSPYGDFTIVTRRGVGDRELHTIAIPPGTGQTYVTPAHAIQSGVPFNFSLNLFTLVTILPYAGGVVTPGNLVGEADLSHTVRLTGLEILDASGKALSGFDITSEAGYDYTPNGIVPEPGTFGLLALPLCALAVRRFRRG